MIVQDLETRIIDVLSVVLQVPPAAIIDDASTQTINTWDSLRHINLISVLEEEFDIELEVSQITRMTSFSIVLKEMRLALNEKQKKL